MYTSWNMKEKLVKGNKVQNGNMKLCSILSSEETKKMEKGVCVLKQLVG